MWKKERDALYYSSKNSGGKKSYTLFIKTQIRFVFIIIWKFKTHIYFIIIIEHLNLCQPKE